jgi:hypothetical protein
MQQHQPWCLGDDHQDTGCASPTLTAGAVGVWLHVKSGVRRVVLDVDSTQSLTIPQAHQLAQHLATLTAIHTQDPHTPPGSARCPQP